MFPENLPRPGALSRVRIAAAFAAWLFPAAFFTAFLVSPLHAQQPAAAPNPAATAAPQVVDLLLDEESQHLAGLSEFIGKPVSLQAEGAMGQEQYDIVLL